MIDLVHVISDTGIGGAGRYLLALLPGASSYGWRVTAIAPKGPLNQALLDTGLCRVIDLPQGEISFSVPIWRWLVRHLPPEADLVHTHASLAARLVAKQRGLPVVITRHTLGPDLPGDGLPAWKRLAQRQLAARLSDGIIAVSEACRQRLIAEGVEERLISLVYHGVDAQLTFRPAGLWDGVSCTALRNGTGFLSQCTASTLPEAGGDSWKERLQVPEFCPVIITVARLAQVKGLSVAVSAAERLQAAGRQFLWLLIGEGPERQALERQIDDSGLGRSVRMLGFQTDIPGILAAADLFVLPSLQEALGLSVLEAMAAALPVVASAVGGIPELISSGEDGLLVEPANPEQLAEAIALLLQDAALRRRMGARAREKVLDQFTLQEMWRQTDLVYRSALGTREMSG